MVALLMTARTYHHEDDDFQERIVACERWMTQVLRPTLEECRGRQALLTCLEPSPHDACAIIRKHGANITA